MEKIIEFEPAYDRTDTDPHKNYGVHGVNMRWLLKGDKGAVQFLLYTNWNLPHVQEKMDKRLDSQFPHLVCHPMPADLGYHSKTPRYEDQQAYDCQYLPEGKCYYDGSSLNAQPVYDKLVAEGGEAVWAYLEDYYKRVFEEE